MVVRPRTGSIAHAQEARSDGVDVFCVKLVKVAAVVNEDGALEGLFGEGVVADAVVSEIVEDFKGEEVAGNGDISIPGEDGAIYDFNVAGVAPGRR